MCVCVCVCVHLSLICSFFVFEICVSVYMLTHISVSVSALAFSLRGQHICPCACALVSCVFRLAILARQPAIKAATPLSEICVAQKIPLSEEYFPQVCYSFHTQWENVSLIQFRTGKNRFLSCCASLKLHLSILICRNAMPVYISRKTLFESFILDFLIECWDYYQKTKVVQIIRPSNCIFHVFAA